jgi:hypothetical protein
MIPAHWRHPSASPFPNVAQTQVLTAIFAPEAKARSAFHAWRTALDLQSPFDSEVFRLLPLLYLRLQELEIEDDLMPRLKGVYRHAWVRNIQLLDETSPAVAALERAGIPTLVLKGAPLALRFYSKQAARPIVDLDMAVPRERLADAIRVLLAAGWISPRVNAGAISVAHTAIFSNARGKKLDLHWGILGETRGKPIETLFWETAWPLDLNGVSTRMLDPALAVAHALVHGLRTNPVRSVRWVADILTIVRHGAELDWDLLVAFGRAAQLARRIYIGLTFIHRRFDAPIPTETLGDLAESPPNLIEHAETAAVGHGVSTKS